MDPVVVGLGIVYLLSMSSRRRDDVPPDAGGGGGGGGGVTTSPMPFHGQGPVTQGPVTQGPEAGIPLTGMPVQERTSPDPLPAVGPSPSPGGSLSFHSPIGVASPSTTPPAGPLPPPPTLAPTTPAPAPFPGGPPPPPPWMSPTPTTPPREGPPPSQQPISPPATVIDVPWWDRGGVPDFCGRSWVPILGTPCATGLMAPPARRGVPPKGTPIVTGPVTGASRWLGSPSCPSAPVWFIEAGSPDWVAICKPPVES